MKTTLCVLSVLFFFGYGYGQTLFDRPGEYVGPGTHYRIVYGNDRKSIWYDGHIVITDDKKIIVRNRHTNNLISIFDPRDRAFMRAEWGEDREKSRNKGTLLLTGLAFAGIYYAGDAYIDGKISDVQTSRELCRGTYSEEECRERYPSYDDSDAVGVFSSLMALTLIAGWFGSEETRVYPHYVLEGALEGRERLHIKLGHDSRFRPRSVKEGENSRFSLTSQPQGLGIVVKF